MNLPADLEKLRDEMASDYADTDEAIEGRGGPRELAERAHMQGFNAAIDHLSRGVEFDYAESRIAFQKHKWPMNETISQHTFWVEGQRAMFDQMKARIALAESKQEPYFSGRVVVPMLEAQIKALEAELSQAMGHSNCYCETCKKLTGRMFVPRTPVASNPSDSECGGER